MLKFDEESIQKLKILNDKENVNLDDINKDFESLYDRDEKGRTLFHWAVELKLNSIICIFLENKIMLDALDIEGKTPFHLSAKLSSQYNESFDKDIDACYALLKAGIKGKSVDQLVRLFSFIENKNPKEVVCEVRDYVWDDVIKSNDLIAFDILISNEYLLNKYLILDFVYFNCIKQQGERAKQFLQHLLDKKLIDVNYILTTEDKDSYISTDQTSFLEYAVKNSDVVLLQFLVEIIPGLLFSTKLKNLLENNSDLKYELIKNFFLSIDRMPLKSANEVEKFLNDDESICSGKAYERFVVKNFKYFFGVLMSLGLEAMACEAAISCIHYEICCDEIKNQAKFEIANLIFIGRISIQGFPIDVSISDSEYNEEQFNQLSQDEKNNIVLKRVIQAYHYLHDNNFEHSIQLINKFNSFLAGDYSGSLAETPWTKQALKMFDEYYKNFYETEACPKSFLLNVMKHKDFHLFGRENNNALTVSEDSIESKRGVKNKKSNDFTPVLPSKKHKAVQSVFFGKPDEDNSKNENHIGNG